ncbi:MAG: glycosyltransferase family 4 protein [Singulisphaera sp.]
MRHAQGRDACRAGPRRALLIGAPRSPRRSGATTGRPATGSRSCRGPPTPEVSPRDERRLGDLGRPPTLLFHGRVDARKGILDLLDASSALVDGGRDLRLIVSGIGPDVAAVGDRVEMLGLGDRVELSGYASYGGPDVYRRGDVFVSPTYSEGFSNTILEAMASGLPIVSTRVVGVVDCLVDGENGLMVEPRDVDALAAAIARMLDDAPLRHRLAARALDEVRTLYSWPAVVRTIQGVYEDVAGDPADHAWTADYDVCGATVDTSDLSCRFRAQPHLL